MILKKISAYLMLQQQRFRMVFMCSLTIKQWKKTAYKLSTLKNRHILMKSLCYHGYMSVIIKRQGYYYKNTSPYLLDKRHCTCINSTQILIPFNISWCSHMIRKLFGLALRDMQTISSGSEAKLKLDRDGAQRFVLNQVTPKSM